MTCLALLCWLFHPKSGVASSCKSHLLLSCANLSHASCAHLRSQVVPPSAFLSSPPPLSCLWLSFRESFGPSVVISPGYMPCPSPLASFIFSMIIIIPLNTKIKSHFVSLLAISFVCCYFNVRTFFQNAILCLFYQFLRFCTTPLVNASRYKASFLQTSRRRFLLASSSILNG